MLPPGCPKLSTKLCPAGSLTMEKTIGVVRVACFTAARTGVELATMTSGAEPTNSAPYACI
jgi:hypothetical protein